LAKTVTTQTPPPLAHTSVSALASANGRRTLVVGVEGGVVRRGVVDVVPRPGDLVVPGWANAVAVADVDVVEQPLHDGDWVGGLFALATETRAGMVHAVKLVPTSLWAVLRGFVDETRRHPPSLWDWINRALVFTLIWWAFGAHGALELVRMLRNRRTLAITRSGVVGDADAGPVDIVAPFKLRAKVRFTRGTQSRKRKVKASFVIKGSDGVEHAIAFRDPESLLRFTHSLQRALGLKVRQDIKLDGVEVGEG
jgi:hypothetical protein